LGVDTLVDGRDLLQLEAIAGVCSKITIIAVNGFPFLRPRVESYILILIYFYSIAFTSLS
jgi:hypothetical protein